MKLLAINHGDKNTKPSFKGVEHFDYIKRLDGMVCAVCGRKALLTDIFIKTHTQNCKPLIYNMQRNALSYIEQNFPQVWALLLSYTKKFPEQPLDTIMEDSKNYIELKQAISSHFSKKKSDKNGGENTVVDRSIGSTFFDMLEASRTYLKPASTVMKNLSSLKSFLTEEQAKVFEILEKYAEKYPDKTLSEIINIEDIYKFHYAQDQIKRKKLYDKMHFHLNNINDFIEKENPQILPEFFTLKTSAIKIFKETCDPENRIYKLKKMYEQALVQNNCEHLKDKIFREIEQIPRIYMTADTFLAFAHKHNYSDGKIIEQLFSSNYTTEEHLDAVAEGGMDRIENKLVMHKSCNQLRNRIPYHIFIKFHPDMQKHVQYQVDLVSEAILKGELPYFVEFYPLKMPLKLAEKTNNVISIDITKFCKEGLKQSLEREKALEKELDTTEILQHYKIQEKMNDKTPNPKLDAEIKELRKKILSIKESIKIEKRKQYRMQDYLKSQGAQE